MNCRKLFDILKDTIPSGCALTSDENGFYIKWTDPFEIWIRLCAEDAHFVKNLPAFKASAQMCGHEWTYGTLRTIHSTWRMGTSLYAYDYPFSKSGEAVIEAEAQKYHDYLDRYKIPKQVKTVILNAVRNSIERINCGIGTDPDGCEYNSIDYKKVD